MQNTFVIDIGKCTGCQACEVACAVENQLEPGTSWRTVSTFNEARYPGIELFHLSLACNHCVDPPCMKHCPALAYSKNDTSGAVTIDNDKCMGCKYCIWACPYDAPRFDTKKSIVTKCTFCQLRQVEGLEPACVSQCPTGALQIAGLETAPGTAVLKGFPDTGAGPAVRFLPLQAKQTYPETSSPAPNALPVASPVPGSKITLKTEWPLVVFTLLISTLAGTMATGGAGMKPLTFAILAAAGMSLSTLHLGKKLRAWRSVLNWRQSWLSREIILFSIFTGLSVIYLSLAGGVPALYWLVTLLGFATLLAVDSVYLVTSTPGLRLHSAQTLLTGTLIAGLVSGSGGLFLGITTIKLILYIYRRILRPRPGNVALILSILRTVPGALIPMWIWVLQPPGISASMVLLVLLCVSLGEIIDRCEFYLDLDLQSPRKQIARDLKSAVNQIW